MSPAFIGFRTGLALILVIGAQNAFVLRQGLRREHVGAVVAVCALSDALLIAAGVGGVGAIVGAAPALLAVLRWGGVLFLGWYGARALWAAIKGHSGLDASTAVAPRQRDVILTALALTWANPHVYLDTVVLVGAISTQFPGQEWVFALGAMMASVMFFASLGFGARLLAPLFARPGAWRVLDGLVALMMFSVAGSLAFSGV